MIAYETRLGKVNISEAYLSKLIGNEVTSCFGVVGMVPNNNKQKILGKFSKEDPIDTGIIYGMNINAIAASITEKVKYVVKKATGINVDKVIVKIDGIKE